MDECHDCGEDTCVCVDPFGPSDDDCADCTDCLYPSYCGPSGLCLAANDYERCEHGTRIGLDDCEKCSLDAFKGHTRRLMMERDGARAALAAWQKRYADDQSALQSKLSSGLERIERLREWIQNWADESCEYGEMDFEACGHNRRHGICKSCSARRVLAQDVFVSGA